ncbi:hypothetical protein [Streptomyces tricolor]
MIGVSSLRGEDVTFPNTTDMDELVDWVKPFDKVTVYATYASLGLGTLTRTRSVRSHMSKTLLCVGDGTPVPCRLSYVVMVVAVLILVVSTLGSAPAWQGAAQTIVAETVAAVVVAVVKPSAYDRM